MLTGKRPRPRVMKRTTSMIEFEFEADAADPMDVVEAPQPSDQQPNPSAYAPYAVGGGQQEVDWMAAYGQQQSHWMMAAAAAAGAHMAAGGGGVMYPRSNHRRNSGDFSAIEIAPFLKACGLCKRELLKKDIYMYRGEVAFCSLECRDMQIKTEERKERRALAKIKTETPATSTGPDASAAAGDSGRTVAYV